MTSWLAGRRMQTSRCLGTSDDVVMYICIYGIFWKIPLFAFIYELGAIGVEICIIQLFFKSDALISLFTTVHNNVYCQSTENLEFVISRGLGNTRLAIEHFSFAPNPTSSYSLTPSEIRLPPLRNGFQKRVVRDLPHRLP